MKSLLPEFQPCVPGDKGYRVQVIQQLLCLHHHGVKCDGEYGAATTAAIKHFQSQWPERFINPTGVIDQQTFDALAKPFVKMLAPMPDALTTYEARLGEMLTRIGSWPIRELGGNLGPWVRFWMDGEDGLPWCAGFSTGVVKMAGGEIPHYWNCNDIAKWPNRVAEPAYGDLFLVPKPEGGFRHVGIVIEVYPEGVIATCEGNSNDDGSAEGNRVVMLFRNYKASNLTFVRVKP